MGFIRKEKELEISVCIPVYNQSEFIADAIESVLNQTMSGFELIVVDNCSKDNTKEIIKKYFKTDNRLKYIFYNNYVNMADNFNRCLRHASCEYIKILCADDLLTPNCLERSLELLKKYPETALICSKRELVDKQLNPIGARFYSDKYEKIKGVDAIKRCLSHGNGIGEPSACVFKKTYAERGFNRKYKNILDLEMWCNILEKGEFIFINETLCKIRIHENQQSQMYYKTETNVLLEELFLRQKYFHLKMPFILEQKRKYEVILNYFRIKYHNKRKCNIKYKYCHLILNIFKSIYVYIFIIKRKLLSELPKI